MLRTSTVNPSVSAFEQLHGPTTMTHIHSQSWAAKSTSTLPQRIDGRGRNTPSRGSTWGCRSWEHYRCQDVWVPETCAVQSGQTAFFKHHHVTHPTITTTDALIHTGQEVCAKLRGKVPDSPLTKQAVETLMNIPKLIASRTEAAAGTQRVRKAVAMAMQKESEKQGATGQRMPASEDEESVGMMSTSLLMDNKESVDGPRSYVPVAERQARL